VAQVLCVAPAEHVSEVVAKIGDRAARAQLVDDGAAVRLVLDQLRGVGPKDPS
jgi:hypothetical protein